MNQNIEYTIANLTFERQRSIVQYQTDMIKQTINNDVNIQSLVKETVTAPTPNKLLLGINYARIPLLIHLVNGLLERRVPIQHATVPICPFVYWCLLSHGGLVE
ncbi:hypothetical protein T07_1436 [Trichinella nelsoni]|uniref:Uncharacterized protein n=1 Tax=Trichinella nelsoni TaxID=6336 RepID=A0A0V0SCU8_9BILA|nr:hypothetical protein T07_1436 [Trichinella nelsoni]